MLVVGDIAGQYNTLMKLLEKVPEEHKTEVLSVGDMVDRGPDSAKVIDWFMNNDKGKALLGNHEHLMLDKYEKGGYYDQDIWFMNGGFKTLESFAKEAGKPKQTATMEDIPLEVIEWVKMLPLYYELDCIAEGSYKFFISHAAKFPFTDINDPEGSYKFFISHAAKFPFTDINDLGRGYARYRPDYTSESCIIWNREPPVFEEGKFQIFGHNAYMGYRTFSENGKDYAMCIDSSRQEVLTGVHVPSLTVYQQAYVD